MEISPDIVRGWRHGVTGQYTGNRNFHLDYGRQRRSNTPLVCPRQTTVGAAPRPRPRKGQVAQLVEQRTENPRVGGSIPPLATILIKDLRLFREILKKPLREFCVT
jgi:hypothetical protein